MNGFTILLFVQNDRGSYRWGRPTMGELPTRELEAEQDEDKDDDGELELDRPPPPARHRDRRCRGSRVPTTKDRLPRGLAHGSSLQGIEGANMGAPRAGIVSCLPGSAAAGDRGRQPPKIASREDWHMDRRCRGSRVPTWERLAPRSCHACLGPRPLGIEDAGDRVHLPPGFVSCLPGSAAAGDRAASRRERVRLSWGIASASGDRGRAPGIASASRRVRVAAGITGRSWDFQI